MSLRTSVCVAALLAGVMAVSGPEASVRAQAPTTAQTGFVFRAGFWLNLHHFLYVLGRAEAGMRDSSRRAVAGAPGDADQGLTQLTPAEQATWRGAVTSYARSLSRRDALFDNAVWRVTAALAPLDERDGLSDRGVPESVRAALESAAPVYLRTWWPAHGRASRTFIDLLQTQLRLDGEPIRATMSRAFDQPWPAEGFTVDVAAYANWAGAYSVTGGPIVLASLDPGLVGSQALETVFHEAAHQWDEVVDRRLRRAAAAAGVDGVPDGLSHAMIFYAAGEATRRTVTGHTPYAEQNGIWAQGPMASFKPALDQHWRPRLQGQRPLDEALTALLRRP